MDLQLATMADIMNEFVRRGDVACLVRWSVKDMSKVEIGITANADPTKVAVTLARAAQKMDPNSISLKSP